MRISVLREYDSHALTWSFTSMNSLNYGVFVFRCFCLLLRPIIKTGRLQEKEREQGRGRMVAVGQRQNGRREAEAEWSPRVFLGADTEVRKGLRALELHFLNTQLSLLVAEELTLGLEQYNTQTELRGKKYLSGLLK